MSSTLDDTLSAFDRVVFATHPSDDDLAILGASRRDRFVLYRELVRSRFRDLVASALPRTAARLGRGPLDALVEARLSESPPTTRFFREVVEQLVTPEDARWPRAALPEIEDLVRLELAQWHANWSEPESERRTPFVAFEFTRVPLLAPTFRRFDLGFSVHRPELPLEAGRFHVAVYRRADGIVETRWMDAALAAILDGWLEGDRSAIDVVRSVLAARAEPSPEHVVERMSGLLAELLERGGVLGSRP